MAEEEAPPPLFPVGQSPADLPCPRRLRSATAYHPRNSRAAWGRLKQVRCVCRGACTVASAGGCCCRDLHCRCPPCCAPHYFAFSTPASPHAPLLDRPPQAAHGNLPLGTKRSKSMYWQAGGAEEAAPASSSSDDEDDEDDEERCARLLGSTPPPSQQRRRRCAGPPPPHPLCHCWDAAACLLAWRPGSHLASPHALAHHTDPLACCSARRPSLPATPGCSSSEYSDSDEGSDAPRRRKSAGRGTGRRYAFKGPPTMPCSPIVYHVGCKCFRMSP